MQNVNDQYHEELLKNQEVESVIENTSSEIEKSFTQEAVETSNIDQQNSADLKEFGVDADEPDLFNSDSQSLKSEDLLGSSETENEEDDLEIPAFLRRQKINGLQKIMEATMVSDAIKHYPVLLNEIISIITPQHGGTFIDCTFGQGGYTNKILSFKNTKVIALDRDIESKIEADKISKNLIIDLFLKIKNLAS